MRYTEIESAVSNIECAAELVRKAVEDATYKAGGDVAVYAVRVLQDEISGLLDIVETTNHPDARVTQADFDPFAAMDADPTAAAA